MLGVVLGALSYPIFVNTSSIVISGGYGTAKEAALVITMYTIGGAVGGIFFATLTKVMGRFTTPIAMLLSAIGMYCLASGSSLSMFMIGTTLAVGLNLGCVLAPYLSSFITKVSGNPAPNYPFYVSAAVLALVAVALFMTRVRAKNA